MSVEMLPATWKRSWVKTWRMQHLFTFRDAPEILCLKTNRIILLSVFMSTLTQCIRKTSLFNCSRETNGHCPPKLAFWNKSTRLHIVLDICSFIKIIWHSSSLCKALFEREFFLAFNKSSFYVSRHLEFSYSANLIKSPQAFTFALNFLLIHLRTNNLNKLRPEENTNSKKSSLWRKLRLVNLKTYQFFY